MIMVPYGTSMVCNYLKHVLCCSLLRLCLRATVLCTSKSKAAQCSAMPVSKERQAELRAAKALREGKTTFKPRGAANRAAYEGMKEELEKKTTQINSHTSSEADRVISAIKEKTQPLPGQTAMAANCASNAVKVAVLNSSLAEKGIVCTCVKADRTQCLAMYVPVHELHQL